MEVPHSICQQICKTQQWPQDWKGELSFQSQRKAMPKNVQTGHLISLRLILLIYKMRTNSVRYNGYCYVHFTAEMTQRRKSLPCLEMNRWKAPEPVFRPWPPQHLNSAMLDEWAHRTNKRLLHRLRDNTHFLVCLNASRSPRTDCWSPSFFHLRG